LLAQAAVMTARPSLGTWLNVSHATLGTECFPTAHVLIALDTVTPVQEKTLAQHVPQDTDSTGMEHHV